MDASYFEIKKGVNPYSFIEYWYNKYDTTLLLGNAIRSWDKTNNRWMFTWISGNNLYQVWEGKKWDENWYITKYFDINGDKYLSRQGFIPQGPNRMMRISEKSYDEGKTWELRFKEFYQKIPTDDHGVILCLDNYLNGDSARLTNAFHPSALLKFIAEDTGELRNVPIADYLKRVAPRAGNSTTVKKRIINYKISGTAAQAELEIRGDNFITHDFMSLLKVGDEWKIVSKIFWRELAPEQKSK